MKCKICKTGKMRKIFDAVNMHGRHVIDKTDTFAMVQCGTCGVVYPRGIKVDKNYYDRYYQPDYYQQDGSKKGLLRKTLSLITRFSNARKERMIVGALDYKKRISVLDIGCGKGNFLMSLDPNGFERHGVEISKEGYKASKKKGIQMYLGDINSIDFGGKKFDAITMWHVLEHIDDPHKLFKKIKTLLTKEGTLIFQIPLTDSIGFRVGKKYWFHLDAPRHLTLFGDKSARKLCKAHKFAIIKTVNEPYEYPLDLFWSLRISPLRFFAYAFYPIIKLFDRETVTYVCTMR